MPRNLISLIADFAIALGDAPINKCPNCWECVIDERWKLACNPHREPKHCSFAHIEIPAGHFYAEYNGWPAGLFSPYDGTFSAAGAANPEAFMDAIEAKIASLKMRPAT
jgi:hypothetical protein